MSRSAFQTVSYSAIECIESLRLRRCDWVLHAFSTRRGAVNRGAVSGLNLGFVGADSAERVHRNRKRFLRALGVARWPLASLRQVHSASIYQVVRRRPGALEYLPAGLGVGVAADAPEEPATNFAAAAPAGDALITSLPGVLLSVRAADCLPVLIADPCRRAVAAIHAGWRGTLRRIVEKTVGEMRRAFGSRPADLIAVLGPSIRACCYEVGPDVVDAFTGCFAESQRFFCEPPPDDASKTLGARFPTLFGAQAPPGRPRPAPGVRLDLVAVARHQLTSAGVSARKIEVAGYCTACRTDLFFSHRREGSRAGRMMAVIGLRT